MVDPLDERQSTAHRYRVFGERDAGSSPTYRAWSLAIAGDPEVIELIDQLPYERRQVNLVFAAARFVGAEAGPYSAFREWLLARWTEVADVANTHATQTNEAARCALLLPVLASLPAPLALIEVGASAGLCLYPDRYSYRYGDRAQLDPYDGPSAVTIETEIEGPVPELAKMPEVVWRAGIDLNPLDVSDERDVAWLDALNWPEHEERRDRLRAAVDIARKDPPRIVRGDLNDTLAALIADAPADATVVVFHTAVLAYLAERDRQRFAEAVTNSRARWVSNEGLSVIRDISERLTGEPGPGDFVIALDGKPVAYAQPHGRRISWI